MKSFTLELPDSVQLDTDELKMLVASRLYECGSLSLGYAADLAGLSKRVSTEKLGRYGVSIFNYPASDIARDVKNA